MSERLGLPVYVDNDSNVALLAEHRRGAARGTRHAVLVALGTGIGSGLLLDGRLYRGANGFGAELGHIVVDYEGEECPGACPGRGCLEVLAAGNSDRARRRRAWPPLRPDSALGRRLAAGREIDGAIVTELAHDGDEAACEVLAEVGRRLGYGLVSVVNALNPEVIVIGGGAVAAGELLLGAGARGRRRACAAALARAGAGGRRPLRRRVGDARRGADGAGAGGRVSGRLVVCPTPIGNLEDVTLRVLSALRDADVVACEDTRRTRVLLDRYGVKARLVSYHEHNERARASELAERMRSGETVALVSDAGMPLVSDPGYVLVRACVAAGVPVEVLPGPSAAITALVASGLPAEAWHFHGFLPRKQGELKRLLGEHGGTLVAFESPRRVPATLKLAAELDPARELAVCRELTKAHEEIVRGSAAELAERYADAPPKGEVVLVFGPPSPLEQGAGEPAGLDALRRLVEAGARPRPAAGVVAELTGGSANALYRALTTERDSTAETDSATETDS